MKKSTNPWDNLNKICPACGSKKVAYMLYGEPDSKLLAEKNEKLYIAGCVIAIPAPNLHCRSCEHEWIDPEFEGME